MSDGEAPRKEISVDEIRKNMINGIELLHGGFNSLSAQYAEAQETIKQKDEVILKLETRLKAMDKIKSMLDGFLAGDSDD